MSIYGKTNSFSGTHAIAVAATFSLLPIGSELTYAQETAALEEIVVVARKRSESIQDVPVAITSIGAAQLERMYAQDLRDLSGRAPNVTINHYPAFSSAAISIRGMTSQDVRATADAAVSVVVDDFFLGHAQSSLLDMFDIEQISILRGPQGTLFGKNTIGGVILVQTKKPSGELEGELELGAANYGRREIKAALDVPLIENTLAARVSVLSNKSDGYYTNLTDGDDIGGDDVLAGRVKLLYTPTEKLDILLSYEYNKDRSDSVPLLNATSADQLFAGIYPGRGVGQPLGDPFETYQFAPADYGLPDHGQDIDIDGYYLTANYELDSGIITYIAGNRSVDSVIYSDLVGAEAAVYANVRSVERETSSHELRFASTFSEIFDFVVGTYYQDNKFDYPILTGLGPGHPFSPNLLLSSDAGQEGSSLSLFTEGNYHITSDFILTLGVRYTEEEKDFNILPLGLPEANRVDVSDDWNNISYRVSANYHFDQAVMAYATFSRGFKSGGFNEQAGSIFSANQSFDEEIADNIELGLKSELFDRRMRFNLALFTTTYDDLQVRQEVELPGSVGRETIYANAGEMSLWGLELETEIVASEHLTLGANIGYLDAEYDDFLFDVDGDRINDDATFLQPINTPELTASAFAQYDLDLGAGGSLSFNGSVTYSDEFYTGTLNSEASRHDEVTLLDASVQWRDAVERFKVSLWIKNATDEEYQTTGSRVANVWSLTNYGPPRTYGLSVGFNF